MHTIYLGLGSNLDDRQRNLERALQALAPSVHLIAASPLYETAPWGYEHQPSFLNQVAQAETSLPPLELLKYLKDIEARLGRQPTIRYGPRLIDLDLLLYDDLLLEAPGLQIPHPRMHERAFVLAPLADLAPDLVHPVLGRTVRDLLAGLDQSGVVRLNRD